MDQRQFFLRDILTVIFKHLRLLVLFPLAVLAVVIVLSYIWPATFESEAKIKIMRGREIAQADPTVTTSSSQVLMSQLSIEDVMSEVELLRSENVMRDTVTALQLERDPSFPFGSGALNAMIRTARTTIRGALYALHLISPRTDVQVAMEDLQSRLRTDPIRDSYVINVALRLGDPKKAKEILTKLLEVHQIHHVKMYTNSETRLYFDELLGDSKKALDEAQNALQVFREAKDISLIDTQKELLLGTYTESQRILAQLGESEKLITQDEDDLDSSVISSLSSQTESTVVREMQLRLLELLLERNRVQKSLGENHPTLQSIREQVREAQGDLIGAIATTKQLEETKRETSRTELDRLNQTKRELDELEKKVELLTKNYEFYWDKREEAVVADKMSAEGVSNVKLISDPSEPTEPVFPRKLFNIALALIGGIIGALALAFLLDYLDHGLKTPEDVEYQLKAPTLASFFNSPGERLDKREAERLAILLDTFSNGGSSTVIQVTSSIPGEGAPQVAQAIADAYSLDPEGRTLLLDIAGDAGGGRGGGKGITDVLVNQASIEEVFRSEAALTVVGRGTGGEAATYLWDSQPMERLMEELRRRYKHIVFNVAPVLRSHDALKLAKTADGILIVIRSDSTRREVVTRALEMYGDNRSRVVGAVLTERTQNIPQAVYRRI